VSVRYAPVKWNRNKVVYDRFVAAGVVLYLTAFVAIGIATSGDRIDPVVLLMRAFGTGAFVLLHIVLCLGPLARLDRRFLPLVYNRRHLGVVTFLCALAHVVLAVGYYHGFGNVNPVVSLLTSNTNYGSLAAFPFEVPGLIAFVVLFLMAATSHDFWQKALPASAWKGLHMLIYPAYALLVAHVALGALQAERSAVYPVLLFVGVGTVAGLHLLAGRRERTKDNPRLRLGLPVAWIDAGPAGEIPDGRAKVVSVTGGERIAVFRHGDRVSAVTNVCAHQRGPLGEGKVVNGCISCPWHGWEYRPEDGCSPPPFQERIATYRVRLDAGRVFVNPEALPPGTPIEPAHISETDHGGS
jgi:nitrite reductase/ring-hydroxylating ferredoxin subunit/DMSO/TMAO reductase YedYZ heme-binding membrane subunit